MANATYGVNIIPKNNTVTLGNNNSPWHAPTPAAGTNNGELANAEFVNSEICNDAASLAIVINGDTAPKVIEKGKYLFIKNHSTLATGGYHATAAIAKNASITSDNVTPDVDGIANSLNSKIADFQYEDMGSMDSFESMFNSIPNGKFIIGQATLNGKWMMTGYRYSEHYGAMIIMHYTGVIYFCSKNGQGTFTIKAISTTPVNG